MTNTVLRFLLAVLFAGCTVAEFKRTIDLRLIDEVIRVGRSQIEAAHT